MAAKKIAATKTAKKSTLARAVKAVSTALRGGKQKAAEAAKKTATKTAKKAAGRESKKPAKKSAAKASAKPKAPRSSVKKGQTYLDNEERAGGPRKLIVERIITEESAADRWGNERAPRRYAECAVLQNDEPTKRRVKVPVLKLVEPAYSLDDGSAGSKKGVKLESADLDEEDDASEDE
ncbi:MAG: hypothetical protein ABIN25_11060 [Ginsengibacter sp.]